MFITRKIKCALVVTEHTAFEQTADKNLIFLDDNKQQTVLIFIDCHESRKLKFWNTSSNASTVEATFLNHGNS